jgi:hypothetical protein
MNLRPGRNERNTYKHMFLSTAAASSLLLAVAAVEPAVFSWATKAEASTSVAASINFYDELAPYGNWVSYQDRYVWIPEGVDDGWRPYTQGHWAYTRSYGWVWVSDEKFGWATYHYGRWGKAPDIGWYWLPGSIWAPAWVAWSYDHYDIAWAPLPPVHYDGVNDATSLGDIPDDYWQALSVSAFLSEDLSGYLFRDRDKVRRVIERGKSWTVSIENNIVVNNVLTIDNIEKRTKKKVVALEEKAVDNPDAASKADSTSVAIFIPEVREEPAAKPKKTRTVEEVVKEREAKDIPEQEQPEQTATTIDEPATKPKDKATGAVVPQDEQQNVDQPDIEKSVEAPAGEQAALVESKKNKKSEELANTRRKGQPECDPAVTDCPPSQTLLKLKPQSTKRVIPKTNLPDAGAESWRIKCSPRFGGWSKDSETCCSSAGTRVSCTMRPTNARG